MPKATSVTQHTTTRKVSIELTCEELEPVVREFLRRHHPEFRGFTDAQFNYAWSCTYADGVFDSLSVSAEKTTTKEKPQSC